MHKMLVLAKAVPGKKEELAKWYDEQHLPDLLAVPGLVTVERHDFSALKQPTDVPAWDFLMIYELAGPDPMEVLKAMASAPPSISDLLESTSTLSALGISQGLRKEI